MHWLALFSCLPFCCCDHVIMSALLLLWIAPAAESEAVHRLALEAKVIPQLVAALESDQIITGGYLPSLIAVNGLLRDLTGERSALLGIMVMVYCLCLRCRQACLSLHCSVHGVTGRSHVLWVLTAIWLEG